MRQPSIKGLKKKLWSLLSNHIKQEAANQDGYVDCYTCDKVLRVGTRDCQVGHCFNKEAYPYLFYHLDNMRVQCSYCNRYKQGDAINFAVRLTEEIGLLRVANLWYNRHNQEKRNAAWYQAKIKELENV